MTESLPQLRSLRVDDQVALVTGAAGGLGRAIAAGLAQAGAHVALAELPGRLDDAADLARAIADATGRRTLAAPVDVTDMESIGRMVGAVVDHFGRLDILVNNAGINITRPALEVTEQDWDRVLDVNLKGVFFCAQAAARQMVRQRRGKIVNLASINGVVGYWNRAAYCSSKGGVVNLTRELALEWAPYGITVNAIGPTYIRTPLTEPTLSDPAVYEDILRRIPLGRLGTPEDVVGAVVFLASPAADLITGHTLLVDGGWTAQ